MNLVRDFPVRVMATAAALWAIAAPCLANETAGDDFAAALDEAVAAARTGDREKAAEELEFLAQQYQEEPVVFYNLAVSYEFDEDGNRYRGANLNVAASYYQQALALDPAFAPALFNLGVVWQKLEFWDAAAAAYRLAAKGDDDIAGRAAYNLALVLKEQGRADAAATVLKEGDPYDDVARVRLLALLAEDRGEVGRAIRLWKRALALGDTPPLNALAVQHLQTLRGY